MSKNFRKMSKKDLYEATSYCDSNSNGSGGDPQYMEALSRAASAELDRRSARKDKILNSLINVAIGSIITFLLRYYFK